MEAEDAKEEEPMRAIACLMLLAATLLAAPASAEISKKFGDYEVHYNVLATADLACSALPLLVVNQRLHQGRT